MQAESKLQAARRGRPQGEVMLAVLRAAHALKAERPSSGQGASFRELVARSQVGLQVARHLVPKLKKRGHLEIVGAARVDYRNRPVALYAPVVRETMASDDAQSGPGWVDLGNCLQNWHG